LDVSQLMFETTERASGKQDHAWPAHARTRAIREVPNKSCVLDGMLEKRKLTYLATGLSTRVPP
jgi:hypothetical protein